MRKIPVTMATQHPDNAGAPYWSKTGSAFIDTRDEVDEAFQSFSVLHCGEYMWDWEGKHVDEAVVERLLERHIDYFRKHQLGKDVFLTFRVPNVWSERGYRLARAFVNILAAHDTAKDAGVHAPPIFETILPLTESGKQVHWVRSKYAQIAHAFAKAELHPTSSHHVGPADISVIPLVETPHALAHASTILRDYVRLCKSDKILSRDIEYIRPFIARSDPALNAGLVPAMLAAKLCLSECQLFTEETNIPTYPIIGVGCLPFRGGLSPESTRIFSLECAGVRTASVQSAYRYDYPQSIVRSSIRKLSSILPSKKARVCDKTSRKKLIPLLSLFGSHYQKTVEGIAPDVQRVASFVPGRRERRQHVGLFGYSRKVGKASLPRAIGFTASLYSLGVPPELIGTGRGLRECEEKGVLDELEEALPTLRWCLQSAGRYLNRENLSALSGGKNGRAWHLVEKDVALIDAFLGEPIGPIDDEQYLHRNVTSTIRVLLNKGGKGVTEEITRAGMLRHSLG